MRSTYLAIILILLLSGCTSPAEEAPACSGPRRPANPYGSVLIPTEARPAPDTPAASRSDTAAACLGSIR